MPSIADTMSGMAEEREAPAKPVREEGSETGPARCLKDLAAESPGKHMLISSDGMGLTTYQVGEDGNVQGPIDTDSQTVGPMIAQFFGDEEQESEPEAGQTSGRESLFDR